MINGRSAAASTEARVVSFDSEPLILVDADDREIGYLDKLDCHKGAGILHRAFSVFIFNGRHQLLLQQRSASKPLWPLYWSNSCCSHPRRGETLTEAARRRLREELGLECPLRFLFRFQYQAQFDATTAENELCSVLIGRTDRTVRANPNEIAASRWIDPAQLDGELARHEGTAFTPWLRLEWARMRAAHAAELQSILGAREWASR